jgi:class 3 adenylate cyclase
MKISLRLKILFFTVLLLILVTFSIGFLIKNEVEKAIKNEIRLRGVAIARNLALNSEDPLVLGDDLYLNQLVTDAMKNEGVRYTVIVNSEGIVIAADSTELWNTKYVPPSGVSLLSEEKPESKSIIYKGESILDIAFPVMLGGKKKVGEIHLGVSKLALELAAKKIQFTVIVISGVFLVIGIIGSILFADLITKPVVDLVKGVKSVARGNFDVRVKKVTSDEIGLLTMAFNDMTKSLKEKKLIKEAFRRYVSHQVAEQIFQDPEKYLSSLKGERKRVAIVFADIRGFTPMAETMEPEEVVKVLNKYLTYMTEAVFKHQGTLDKFIGDCVMAVYGAPLFLRNPTEMAVRTAIEIQRGIDTLNGERVANGENPIEIGIGINTGEAVVGNIGSEERRLDYTVIGDNVNLASRLQTAANIMGVRILISKKAFEYVADIVEAHEIPPLKVRGKKEPVEVYIIDSLKVRAV